MVRLRHVSSEKDIQFKRNFGWNALCEFIDGDIFFGACAFVMGLEGHVFTDFLDNGRTGERRWIHNVPRKKRNIAM